MTDRSPTTDDAILERVRGDISSPRAHFNHAGMSLTPAPVLARVHAHLDLEAELGGYEAAAAVADELADVPRQLAPLLGVPPDDVITTESATAASEVLLWSIAHTFGYTSRDRILVDEFAYATAYSALHRLQQAGGAEVVAVSSQPDGTIDLDALARAVDERTRLVLVTHMPTHVGTVTDIERVGRVVTNAGAIFVVDVSQTLGQLSLDLERIGCDVAFAPGRKFLHAPRGTGIAYVRATLAERLVPLTPPFGAIVGPRTDTYDLPPGAQRFAQFEYGVAARLGLGAAARYANDIGLERIAALVAARSRAVVDSLAMVDKVTLAGGPGSRGIISFVHASLDAREVSARLAASGINAWVNVSSGAPLDTSTRHLLPSVRLSPHYVTNDDDLDRLRVALQALT